MRSQPSATGQTAGPIARGVARPDVLELAHQRPGIGVQQLMALDVEHRLVQARMHQSFGQLRQIREIADVPSVVGGRPGRPQLPQVSGPKVENRNSPRGLSTRASSRYTRSGRSHHCSIRLLKTRSMPWSASGSAAASAQMPVRREPRQRRQLSSAGATPSRPRAASPAPDRAPAPWHAESAAAAAGHPGRCRPPDRGCVAARG